jgi:hypothetical protein
LLPKEASQSRNEFVVWCLDQVRPSSDDIVVVRQIALFFMMTKITKSSVLVALLTLALVTPRLFAQNAEALAKVEAISQQLQLTPQQQIEVIPILKQEAPKIQAIKNDPSLSGLQKVKQLRAIHQETAPKLQQILSPAQYQKLQEIRQQDIKEAMAKKRAGG